MLANKCIFRMIYFHISGTGLVELWWYYLDKTQKYKLLLLSIHKLKQDHMFLSSKII